MPEPQTFRSGFRPGWSPGCLAPALALAAGLAAIRLVAGAAGPAAPDLVGDVSHMQDADRAFASLARRAGVRSAFLASLGEGAVVFRPGPVAAREFIAARPSPEVELIWTPVHAAIAASGDLGYTSGPYEVRGLGADHPVRDQGYYVTIWRKQVDGSWKVVLDQGVTTPPAVGSDAVALATAVAASSPAAPAASAPAPAAPGLATPADSAASAALLAADRELAGDAAAHGARAAYMSRLAPDVRLYREGDLPALGRDAAGHALAAGRQPSSWEPTAAAASAAGDLGYTYGDCAVMGALAPRHIERSSVYLRIWQRDRSGSPRIVLDLVKPLPPPVPPA